MISLVYYFIYLRHRSELFLFWFISSILWYTVPSILNDIYPKFDLNIGFSLYEKSIVTTLEITSLLIWSIPFFIFPKIKINKKSGYKFRGSFEDIVTFIAFLGLISFICYVVGVKLNLPFSFLYVQLSVKLLPIFCVYTIYNSNNSLYVFFSFILLLMIAVGGGSHGPIVFMGIYSLYLAIKKKKYFRRTAVAMSIVLISLISYGDLLHEVRSLDIGKISKLSVLDKLALISGVKSNINDLTLTHESDGTTNLEQVIWRFGENRRVSSGYLRWVKTNGFVGSAPVLNSLKSIIPRQYWSDKPEPGSYDGSQYGKGMHVIHLMTYGNGKNMSSFYTGLHEYWQYGVFGVLVLPFIVGVLQYSVIAFFLGLGVYGRLCLLATFSIWWQMPKLWLSEVILHLFTIYLPLLLIFVCYHFFNSLKLNLKNSNMESI